MRSTASCSARARPRPVHDARGRRRGTGSTPTLVEDALAGLEARDLLVRGELRPGGVEREWCDPDVLRRIRRASLAVLRRQVEPAEQAALGRFLPGWHGIDRRATLREALVPLQGLALPVSLWETEILPRRVPGYQPASLDQLCATGEVVWVGAGPRPRGALLPRRRAASSARRRAASRSPGRCTTRSARRSPTSAEFWLDLARPRRRRPDRRARGAVGARLERRGDERRLGAAPREAPLRRPDRRAPPAALLAVARGGRRRDRRPLVARRAALRAAPGRARRPTAARSPSSCSSGRGSSRATASARRGSSAATAPSTGS